MNETIDLMLSSAWQLIAAMVKVSIPLTVISFALALVLACITAAARMSRFRLLRAIFGFYVWVFRGTPLLVQLFIVFFGLPKAGIVFDAWSAAIVTFSLNTGAYASEAVRAAVLSIPKGQFEAASSLGLTGGKLLRFVVAPQALRIALPTLTNDLIDLFKGTSLVSTITLLDVFMVAQQITARTYQPLILYVEVAILFLIIVTALTWLQAYLEKRASRFIQR
ncbi:MAG: amino acid ABC transporter permease [Actinomycetaceae bacterium]|nr:amino acid ABC transporter permease [Actinomycetaceae bacterium]